MQSKLSSVLRKEYIYGFIVSKLRWPNLQDCSNDLNKERKGFWVSYGEMSPLGEFKPKPYLMSFLGFHNVHESAHTQATQKRTVSLCSPCP